MSEIPETRPVPQRSPLQRRQLREQHMAPTACKICLTELSAADWDQTFACSSGHVFVNIFYLIFFSFQFVSLAFFLLRNMIVTFQLPSWRNMGRIWWYLSRFCLECTRQYIEGKLSEHRIHIKCPDECTNDVPVEELQRILDASQFSLYTRLVAEHQDQNIRECPSCKALIPGNPNKPNIKCACGQQFCFYHGSFSTGFLVENLIEIYCFRAFTRRPEVYEKRPKHLGSHTHPLMDWRSYKRGLGFFVDIWCVLIFSPSAQNATTELRRMEAVLIWHVDVVCSYSSFQTFTLFFGFWFGRWYFLEI